jgi:hypothetical protein
MLSPTIWFQDQKLNGLDLYEQNGIRKVFCLLITSPEIKLQKKIVAVYVQWTFDIQKRSILGHIDVWILNSIY